MAKKSEEEVAVAGAAKKEKLEPKVRKVSAAPKFEWALNPMKLQAATTHVDANNSGLTAQERHDLIKERYVELKGRLPGEKRHKDAKNETGTPRPTSAQAIAYDEGNEPGAAVNEDDDLDDDEDVDGLVEEEL